MDNGKVHFGPNEPLHTNILKYREIFQIYANCKAFITLLLKMWGLPSWTGGCHIIDMTGGKNKTALGQPGEHHRPLHRRQHTISRAIRKLQGMYHTPVEDAGAAAMDWWLPHH